MIRTRRITILDILVTAVLFPLDAKFKLNESLFFSRFILFYLLRLRLQFLAHELIHAYQYHYNNSRTDENIKIMCATPFTWNAANIIFWEIGTNSFWNEKFEIE